MSGNNHPTHNSDSTYRSLSNLIPYLYQYFWGYLIGFIFMFIHNYGFVGLTNYLKLMMGEILDQNRSKIVIEYLIYALSFLFLTCGFMYYMRYLIIGNSRKIEYKIRRNLFEKLMNLPIRFYQKEQTGDLVSRITNDLNDVRTLLGPGIMYIPNSLSRLGFFIPVMSSISEKLLLVILSQMLILIIVIFIVMPKLRPFYKRIQEARANINNISWQIIFGINTIKLNNMERKKRDQFLSLNQKYYRRNMSLALLEGITWPFFFFFFSLSQVMILWIGGKEIIEGNIRIEELLQFSMIIGVITFPIFSLGWVMSILQQGTSAWERINKIFLQPQEKKYQDLLPDRPLEIELQRVSLKGQLGKKIIKDISLKIQPGQLIGITGKTGSGKTLLLELISGITPPSSGRILIGGKNIHKIDKKSLYQKLSFTPQETFLFSTSIKNNIGFLDDPNPLLTQVIHSAQTSDLEKDIENFPNKYQEILGERGINLSGGQKQRTAISRAIYQETDILILDDSLSNIDSQTEENIINNLKSLKSLKTIIVVSHKISLLKIADEILFLKEGQITEKGTHRQLVAQKGHYAQIARLQRLEKNLKLFNQSSHGKK